jgi:hypothetical protein
MKLNSCGCAVCESLKNENISEYDLHVFVGMHKATHKSALRVFESDLRFSSVTHWDIGFCDEARYYIYRDDRFNVIAWYDTALCHGYKLV